MKKALVVAVLLLAGFAGMASADVTRFTETLPPASSYGQVPVANGYDWSLSQNSGVIQSSATIALKNQTLTQIVNSTASFKGQMAFCTNCAAAGGAGTVCISTGTTLFNQFVLSTGTVCQ